MPRVKLVELPAYEYSCSLEVRATDINYAGHLGNEALLGLVHEARSRFLKRLNFNTMIGSGQAVGLIISDLVVNFKAEAFARDQLIIDSQIGELGKNSFRLFHRAHRKDELIALIETGVVTYSYQARQVVELSPEFLKGLQDYREKSRQNEHELENPG